MGIDFRLNGRRVQPGQVGREVARDLEARVRATVERRALAVLCPVHRQAPTTTWAGDEMKVTACCEAGTAAVETALGMRG